MEKEYNEKKKNEKLVLELLQLYDISSAKGILAIKEMLDATEYDLLKRLGKVMFRCIENEINVLQIQELFSNYIESDMHSSKIEKKNHTKCIVVHYCGRKKSIFSRINYFYYQHGFRGTLWEREFGLRRRTRKIFCF